MQHSIVGDKVKPVSNAKENDIEANYFGDSSSHSIFTTSRKC